MLFPFYLLAVMGYQAEVSHTKKEWARDKLLKSS